MKEEHLEMQETSKYTNTIGMFDIIKGIGICLVILGHTIQNFDINVTEFYLPQGNIWRVVTFFAERIVSFWGNSLMFVFFIIAGYGFRAVKINRKSLKKQIQYLMKPYLYIAISVTVSIFFSHYILYQNGKNAVVESLKQFGGFGLGMIETYFVNGRIIFYSSGPAWYIYTLFVSWVLLLFICQIFNKEAYIGVGVSLVIGCILHVRCPAIPHGFLGATSLYAGYIIKKKKWFQVNTRCSELFVLSGSFIFFCFRGIGFLPENEYISALLDFIIYGISAYFVIKYLLYLNAYRGNVVSFLGKVGRISFWVLCAHSVEYIAGRWYLVAQKFAQTPLTGIMLILALRCSFIYICVLGIMKINSINIMKRKKRNAVVKR